MAKHNTKDRVNSEELTRKERYLMRILLGGESIHGKRILDAGCGNGDRTATIMRYGGPKYCLGIDIDVDSVKRASASHNLNNLEFLHGDIENFNGSFDIIIMSKVLHHVKKVKRALDNCYRMLPKGGVLIIDEQNRYSAMLNPRAVGKGKFVPRELIGCLRRAGFREIKYRYHIPFCLKPLKFALNNMAANILVGRAYFIHAKK
ncbi:MAG: methyltransferase domain-containing protein [archaeon]